MEAKYAHQLVVSRNGAVRERGSLTKPVGEVLGWVLKEADGQWQASLPGGILVGTPRGARYEAVTALLRFHKKAKTV